MAIYFHTCPSTGVIGLAGLPFSLPTFTTHFLILSSIRCFLRQSMHYSMQHTMGSFASNACFTGQLISRLWPPSQQREFSFYNPMNTSQVPTANLDSSYIITSPETCSWISLINSNGHIRGFHNHILSLYIYLCDFFVCCSQTLSFIKMRIIAFLIISLNPFMFLLTILSPMYNSSARHMVGVQQTLTE